MERVRTVNKGGRPPKVQLVKQQLRHAILRGDFVADEQLAGYREVAGNLGVSPLTAKRAIDELVREGWLISRHGVGTFVSSSQAPTQISLSAPRRGEHEDFLNANFLDHFHQSQNRIKIVLSSEPDTDILFTDSYGTVVDRLTHKKLESLEVLAKRFNRGLWKLPQRLREMATYDGHLYGLPLRLDLQAIQVNSRLLNEAGIKVPQRYMDVETFEAILHRCRLDRDGDGVFECYGTFHRLWLNEWLTAFWQRGGRLDDRSDFFQDEALTILDELWRWYHQERVLPLEIVLGDNEFVSDYARERFESEKIAMRWVNGNEFWQPMPFHAPVCFPRFGPVHKLPAHAIMLGIHKDSRHSEAALQFLDFCHASFVEGNTAYPFAQREEDRRFLTEEPGLHDLLRDGLRQAVEPLQEGIPQRTWAIEKEIYRWYRLLQDRETTRKRLKEHWRRNWAGPVELPRHAVFGAMDYRK